MKPPIIYDIIIWIAEIKLTLNFPVSLNSTPSVTAPLKWQPHTGERIMTMHKIANATVGGSLLPTAEIFTL